MSYHPYEIEYRRGFKITPSDSTTTTEFKGLYVGTAGAVSVVMADQTLNDAITLTCPQGLTPISFIGVKVSGTTASNLFGLY